MPLKSDQLYAIEPSGRAKRSRIGARSRPKPRTRGARAATNRAQRMRADLPALPAHKAELLRVTGRLLVHFENASDRLFREGELTQDGRVRELLPRIIELAKVTKENIAYLSDGDGAVHSDPFAKYAREHEP